MKASQLLLTIFVFMSCYAFSLEAQKQLKTTIKKFEKSLNAKIGVSAIYIEHNKSFHYNHFEFFPMASTRKIAIAVKFLTMVEHGDCGIDDLFHLEPGDWRPGSGILSKRTVFAHSLISLRECLNLMLEESDNVATDIIMREVGGPQAITSWLQSHGIMDMHLDRTSKEIVGEYNGIFFTNKEHYNKNQYMKKLNAMTKKSINKAHKKFLTVKKDVSTPQAMISLLMAIEKNILLDEATKQILLMHMRLNHKGDKRINGLLPLKMDVAHKGGTLGDGATPFAVTNDTAIITLPDNKGHILIAIFIKSDASTYKERTDAIAQISRNIFDYLIS